MEIQEFLVIYETTRDNLVSSTDHESFQQLRAWFFEHFFAPLLVALFVSRIVSVTAKQIWREKISKKLRSIRLLR